MSKRLKMGSERENAREKEREREIEREFSRIQIVLRWNTSYSYLLHLLAF